MPLGNEDDGVRLILQGYNSDDPFQIPRRKDTPRGKRFSFIPFSVASFIFPLVQCVYHVALGVNMNVTEREGLKGSNGRGWKQPQQRRKDERRVMGGEGKARDERSWWKRQRGKTPEAGNPGGSVSSWWALKPADAACFPPSLPLLPVPATAAFQAGTVSVEDQARVVEEGT